MYYSGTWKPHEMNYHSSELETLAIVKSIKKFECNYLNQDKIFFIFTDCKAALNCLTKENPGSNNRMNRWKQFISSHSLCMLHKKGELNGLADFLSRYKRDKRINKLPEFEKNILKQRFRIRSMVNNNISEQIEDEITENRYKEINDYDLNKDNDSYYGVINQDHYNFDHVLI